MLSDQIITFATLLNAAIFLGTLIAMRKSSGKTSVQGLISARQSSSIPRFAEFELPGLPPVLPPLLPIQSSEPENVGNRETVIRAVAQPNAVHPGRTPKQVMRGSGFAPPSMAVRKTSLHPAQAAELLIATMNAEGYTGLFTASEIDQWWENIVALEDLEEMSAQFVRGAMAKHHLGQKRLNTPEYRHIRQRTGQTRAILYRIPKCRALSGDQPAVPDSSSASSEVCTASSPGAKPGGKPVASRVASQKGAKPPVNAGLFMEAA